MGERAAPFLESIPEGTRAGLGAPLGPRWGCGGLHVTPERPYKGPRRARRRRRVEALVPGPSLGGVGRGGKRLPTPALLPPSSPVSPSPPQKRPPHPQHQIYIFIPPPFLLLSLLLLFVTAALQLPAQPPRSPSLRPRPAPPPPPLPPQPPPRSPAEAPPAANGARSGGSGPRSPSGGRSPSDTARPRAHPGNRR